MKIDPRIDDYATEALNYWSHKLSFTSHKVDSQQCNLDIEHAGLRYVFLDGVNEAGHVLGAAALPDTAAYTDTVYIFRHRGGKVYPHTIAHEIGHALGFRHTPDIGLMSAVSNDNWNLTPAEISTARADRVTAKLRLMAVTQ